MLFVSLTRYKTERFVRWHYTSHHGPQHSATVRKKWCESTSRFCKLGILLKHSHTSRKRFYRLQRLAAGNFPKKPPDSLAKHSHPKLGRLISPPRQSSAIRGVFRGICNFAKETSRRGPSIDLESHSQGVSWIGSRIKSSNRISQRKSY
jgi:hypothetical protein